MNKKSKKTLENAFNIPEPNQKDSFFNKLDIKPERKFSSLIPVYLPTAIVAVMVIGVWGSIKNLPHFQQPDNIDTVSSAETTFVNNNTDDFIQTSLSYVSSSERQIQTTTAFQENNADTVKNEKSTYVTTTSEKVAESTTVKNNDSESSENSPSENDSESTTESPRTTAENTTRTARRTTTTTRTTTVSTQKTQPATTEPTTIHVPATRTTTTTEHIGNGFIPIPQTTTAIKDGIEPPALITTTIIQYPTLDTPPDYTVSPPVRYYPDDNAIDINDFSNDGRPAVPGNTSKPPSEQDGIQTGIFDSWQNLADNSDMIVIADVDEIIYTGIDGVPYTQENIMISRIIKGNIEQRSRISVYGKGGYIPASEHGTIQIPWAIENNYTLFDPAENQTFSEVGDRYIYFIKKGDYPFPDGSYSLTTLSDMSKFRYKNGNYINMNNNNITFTLTELYEYINH